MFMKMPVPIGAADIWSTSLVLITLAALAAAGRAGAGEAPLIPIETIFGNPERVAPQISPDGARLAYLAPDHGVLNVWVRTVGKTEDRALTQDRGRGIISYFWSPKS